MPINFFMSPVAKNTAVGLAAHKIDPVTLIFQRIEQTRALRPPTLSPVWIPQADAFALSVRRTEYLSELTILFWTWRGSSCGWSSSPLSSGSEGPVAGLRVFADRRVLFLQSRIRLLIRALTHLALLLFDSGFVVCAVPCDCRCCVRCVCCCSSFCFSASLIRSSRRLRFFFACSSPGFRSSA